MSDFQTVFFVYQIKGVQCIISNKIISLTISRGQILPHKMPFFLGFENDDILSSKSYTVTKSGISPQRKLGSSRNLRVPLDTSVDCWLGGTWC